MKECVNLSLGVVDFFYQNGQIWPMVANVGRTADDKSKTKFSGFINFWAINDG